MTKNRNPLKVAKEGIYWLMSLERTGVQLQAHLYPGTQTVLSELPLILSPWPYAQGNDPQTPLNHIFIVCSPRGERLFLHPHFSYSRQGFGWVQCRLLCPTHSCGRRQDTVIRQFDQHHMESPEAHRANKRASKFPQHHVDSFSSKERGRCC